MRRARTSRVARLRRFWIPIALVVCVLGGGVAFVVTWPGFAPKTVTVLGNHVVPAEEIVARAAVSRHLNLWLQNPSAIATRVETIPYVGTASVHRVPPSTVAISVTERVPFAVVRTRTSDDLVDRDLRVLGPATEAESLPVFEPGNVALGPPGTFSHDEDLTSLRDAYVELSAAHVGSRELSLDRFGGLVARLPGGERVLFGDDQDFARKLALVHPILAQAQTSHRELATIDLRAPATPVVVYK